MHARLLLVSGIALAGLGVSAEAASTFRAFTDRVGYTGTVSTFENIDDAIAGVSATGVYAIPNRPTASPFNTPSRDAGINFAQNFGGDSRNNFTTAWYYATSGGRYGGIGNPNNVNEGFIQLLDIDGSTTMSKDASFGDFNGTHWTTFTLAASGEFATFEDDMTRLWAAPAAGGAASTTHGLMYSWSLNITFTGLQGVQNGGVTEANDHPDGVMGTFTAVFINEGSNSALNGFYRADFTFNMDSWANGQNGSLVGGAMDNSHFVVVVPAPAAASVMGLAGVMAARRRRR